MAHTLAHRGPDEHGVTQLDDADIAFGHRRLSILDLSPSGSQPMQSRSGRWVIVLNGEIYNHRTIRDELAGQGHRFRGSSDTEVAIEAIEAWGIERALARFEGMFAFAAFDTARRTLSLVRDRLGEKPLYWWSDGSRLAFASELRALRTLPDVPLDIDPASVSALLRWSFIPHPHTIYRDVRQLQPGGLVTVTVSQSGTQLSTTEHTWWSLDDTVASARSRRTDRSLDQAADELHQLLAAAVADRLESDVPIGAFLSGGIDSSLVATYAQRALGSTPLSTFTVSMPAAGLDESAHAAAVARHIGSNHHTLDLGLNDVFDIVPRLATIYDEPFADPSMLPSVLLCQAARKHVTVCLGGDGGDEVFAGYNRHILGTTIDRFGRRLPNWLTRTMATGALALPPGAYDRVARLVPGQRIPLLGDKIHKAADLLRHDDDVWDTLAGIWPATALHPAPHHPRRPAPLDGDTGIERIVLADTASVLPDQMLVKVDRASMAASLEVRSPFLDSNLLEWAWTLPMSLKADRGTGKLPVRHLAARLLPAQIAQRPKLGFDPPLATWLRNRLRPWADDLLARPACVDNGWLDRAELRSAWADHQAGRRNREYQLWAVLMLESWLAEHHPNGTARPQ